MASQMAFGVDVMLLILSNGALTFFYFLGSARIWPFSVAWERGGNFRSCATVIAGKLIKNLDSIAIANV